MRTSAIILFVLGSLSSQAQETAPWWKSLFRAKDTVKEQPHSHEIAPINVPGFSTEEKPGEVLMPAFTGDNEGNVNSSKGLPVMPGSYSLTCDEGIAQLDSAWKSEEHPVQGYRVQIFLGPLQEARKVRAQIRKISEQNVYLSSMPPSYRVTIGDFRDKWSAERQRQAMETRYSQALVVPMPIRLPALDL